MTVFLVELDVYSLTNNQIETRRFSTEEYQTKKTDTPSLAIFSPRITDAGTYTRHMFTQRRTMGESEVGYGAISLANPDGVLDQLLTDYAFSGHPIRIYSLPDRFTSWSERETILIATMDQATFPAKSVDVRIKDNLFLLRVPILTEKYLGTTISGSVAAAEGPKDFKDIRKPRLYGRRKNIAGVLVDSFNFVYQFSTILHGVVNVLDRLIPLTFNANYATLAALKAATIPAGSYATCLALGLVRTGAKPDGILTAECFEGATLADRSVARIVQRMISGLYPFNAADFDALHAEVPAENGVWVETGEVDVLTVANTVLRSVSACLVPDRFGVLRLYRLKLPTGEAEHEITANIILENGTTISRFASDDEGDGVPYKEITVKYDQNSTVMQKSDIGTAATAERIGYAEQQWRQVTVQNTDAMKLAYPNAPSLTVETTLLNEADALAQANYLLALYGTRRDFFSLLIPDSEVSTFDLNDVVSLRVSRFSLETGRLFRILGIAPARSQKVTTVEVWG